MPSPGRKMSPWLRIRSTRCFPPIPTRRSWGGCSTLLSDPAWSPSATASSSTSPRCRRPCRRCWTAPTWQTSCARRPAGDDGRWPRSRKPAGTATPPWRTCWPRSTSRSSRPPGVTFVRSLLERVIEERAKGDPTGAAAVRQRLLDTLGGALGDLEPGSAAADGGQRHAASPKACGRSTSRSASDPTRRSSPRPRCSPPSATAPQSACSSDRPGTTRNPRSCSSPTAAAPSSAPPSATTSTCATSKAAARCCSAPRRTTTPLARSGR